MKSVKLLLSTMLLFGMVSCSSSPSQSSNARYGNEVAVNRFENIRNSLPSRQVSQMLIQSPNLMVFEQRLNALGGINNLDLDNDDVQDQLSVRTIRRGINTIVSIVGIYDDGNINLMEIVIGNGNRTSVECYPNTDYYGVGSYSRAYYSRTSASALLFHYLTSPRYMSYSTSYNRHGYYGNSVYVRHHIVPITRYRKRNIYITTHTSVGIRYKKSTRPTTYKKSYTVSKRSSVVRSSITNQTKSNRTIKKGTNKKVSTSWGSKNKIQHKTAISKPTSSTHNTHSVNKKTSFSNRVRAKRSTTHSTSRKYNSGSAYSRSSSSR